MKLNKKGIQKVLDNVFLTCDEETGYIVKHWMPDEDEEDFELDDFEGVVCLTLEEAKRVQSALYELLRNSNDKNSKEWLTYWMVNGRVEQAEDK